MGGGEEEDEDEGVLQLRISPSLKRRISKGAFKSPLKMGTETGIRRGETG